MLQITIPKQEIWDDEKQEFTYLNECTIRLEHSLVAISKWESRWCKPFLNNSRQLTNEEVLDYIHCMMSNKNVDPLVYYILASEYHDEIINYIDHPSTATTFYEYDDGKKKSDGEVITSELIYYWMTSYNIPFEAEKWHIHRLIALIKICNIKNSPPKQRTKEEILAMQIRINEENKKKFNTSG